MRTVGLHANQFAGAESCGKGARWKSPKTDFSTSLGNPAKNAAFPLSHSYDDCWLLKNKTGHFTC